MNYRRRLYPTAANSQGAPRTANYAAEDRKYRRRAAKRNHPAQNRPPCPCAKRRGKR